MQQLDSLPISEVLPRIHEALSQSDTLVLQAEPGAGKTTVVPLALLEAAWRDGGRILVAEPRRLAAKSAAERMASILGETAGETVGYRVRLERKVSPQTRIEVLTYGMLVHELQSNMNLEGVSAVILDEFHERPIDADLALAQLLYMRPLLRQGDSEGEPTLRLILMSATLDRPRLQSFFEAQKVETAFVDAPGRQYPVALHYGASARLDTPLNASVLATLKQALASHEGHVLVFLPGKREIQDLADALNEVVSISEAKSLWYGLEVVPLHGDMSLSEQRRAIVASNKDQRKVVLATALAESSVTVAGVGVVIDSGRARVQKFDPKTGISRLDTLWVSVAASDQRAGRAGRLGPGACYRLWSENQQSQLPNQLSPEICRVDLSTLVWTILSWGVDDLMDLPWLDQPPTAATSAAKQLLHLLGICSANGRMSHLGQALTGLSISGVRMSPRQAVLLAWGVASEHVELAAATVTLLEESRLRQQGSDLMPSVDALISASSSSMGSMHQLFRRWRKRAEQLSLTLADFASPDKPMPPDLNSWDNASVLAWLCACAYPDRIACLRPGTHDQYLLSNGRGARLLQSDGLLGSPWLVVMDLSGRADVAVDIIRLSVALPETLVSCLKHLITEENRCEWDASKDRLVAASSRYLGALRIDSRPIECPDDELIKNAVSMRCVSTNLACLAWPSSTLQFQARVVCARRWLKDAPSAVSFSMDLPDLTQEVLIDNLSSWFFPMLNLEGLKTGSDLKGVNLQGLLEQQLSWEQRVWLDTHFPAQFETPAKQKVDINYFNECPTVSAKLQAFLGCQVHPSIMQGQIPLTVELLSPAQRPIQVTQDLPGFWSSSYDAVKKEMKGRYPKHPWPDDPQHAMPTLKTKPRP